MKPLLLMIVLGLGMAGTAFADSIVILTRHGDRDDLAENLNAKGKARAEALVAAVAEFDIAAIYAPAKQRNLDTAAPLAAARNLQVQVLDPFKELPALKAAPDGRAVIWVGNTDNLERLFEDLGGEGTPPEFYGDLWILTLGADGRVETDRRHYGE